MLLTGCDDWTFLQPSSDGIVNTPPDEDTPDDGPPDVQEPPPTPNPPDDDDETPPPATENPDDESEGPQPPPTPPFPDGVTNPPEPPPSTDPPPPVTLPTASGWTFYGPAQGGPRHVLGVTADEGGNVWIAGGTEGLFLLRAGAASVERFTLADGLHPYGYLPDGSDVPGPHFLNVLSVSGGPAGTVFVGYGGKPTGAGNPTTCENNWDLYGGQYRDANIYKSGDADRVMLTADGIRVVHYDIFSGPDMVPAEREGRERICDILRIRYSKQLGMVWFGGNHGFAFGDPNFQGIQETRCVGPTYGDNLITRCTGNTEHAHPMISGYNASGNLVSLSDGYRGIDVDSTGATWVGGVVRSLRFDFGPNGRRFWEYESRQFDHSLMIDVWKDAKPDYARPEERTDDLVSALSTSGDGSAWVGSFNHGLAHVGSDGRVIETYQRELVSNSVHAVQVDVDGSVWAGGWAGITRLNGAVVSRYGANVFGYELLEGPVTDIQMFLPESPLRRRMLVGFMGANGKGGAVGIYSGE